MLRLVIPSTELWDEEKEEFINSTETVLLLEHSLLSLAEWESHWEKPFLSKDKMTVEQTIDYIKCMTLNKDEVDPKCYDYLSADNLEAVNNYLAKPMTATTIKDKKGKKNNEIITAEIIYYWMVSLQIPIEFQEWNLNRLLVFIRVCDIKNSSDQKMSKRELLNSNKALNAARRSKMHSRG